MKILRAYKTELDLTNRQKTRCAKHAGAARYAYNWGLARKQEAFRSGQKAPSAVDLHRELNILKRTEVAWMYEVSKCAPQEALRDLDRAFAHFFRRLRERKAGKRVKAGYPRYKYKKTGARSFRLTGRIRVFHRAIKLPRLGILRLKEPGYLPVNGVHILSATVREHAGRWFVSLHVEEEIPSPVALNRPSVGVDLGVAQLATVSDGSVFENPRALKRFQRRLKRLQRIASRRQKGSVNYSKATRQLARVHMRVRNVRSNGLHHITSQLAKTKSAIMLEYLNVGGMLKNHHLANAITDVSMYEFRRQMEYKGQWYGCAVSLADQFFPSTKRCSQCGQLKQAMTLADREYRCEFCGLVIDRDLNAAINLKQLLNGR